VIFADVVTAPSSKCPRQQYVGGSGGRRDFTAGRPLGDAAAGRKPVQAKARLNDRRPRYRGRHGGDPQEEVKSEEFIV